MGADGGISISTLGAVDVAERVGRGSTVDFEAEHSFVKSGEVSEVGGAVVTLSSPMGSSHAGIGGTAGKFVEVIAVASVSLHCIVDAHVDVPSAFIRC